MNLRSAFHCGGNILFTMKSSTLRVIFFEPLRALRDSIALTKQQIWFLWRSLSDIYDDETNSLDDDLSKRASVKIKPNPVIWKQFSQFSASWRFLSAHATSTSLQHKFNQTRCEDSDLLSTPSLIYFLSLWFIGLMPFVPILSQGFRSRLVFS